MKQKAYLLINTRFHPSVGGVETTLRGMATSLSKKNHKVIVVSNNLTNKSSVKQPYFENIFGADVYRYDHLPGLMSLRTCIPLLLKLKKQYDFEIIISRSVFTTICCILAGLKDVKYVAPALAKNQNKPLFMGRSGFNFKERIRYYLDSSIERALLNHLDKVYVFSSNMIEQIEALNNKIEIVKVFPGVDLERFKQASPSEKQALRLKYELPTDKKIIIFPARIEKVKNPQDAVDLLKYLTDDYILVFIGEGSFKKELLSYIEQKNFSNRIYFHKFTTEPENFFKLADFFVLSSVYEPFGQVILESLATNTPVFGYESSNTIQTATSEIFDFLNINTHHFLSPHEKGPEGIATLIKRFVSSSDEKVNFSVHGWYDFISDIKLK